MQLTSRLEVCINNKLIAAIAIVPLLYVTINTAGCLGLPSNLNLNTVRSKQNPRSPCYPSCLQESSLEAVIRTFQPGVVVRAFNLSCWKAEVGGSPRVQNQSGATEFQISLG